MRAVIYARYSCEKQTELSIEGQMDVCMDYAAKNDLQIIGTYIDRAISGRTDDRPQFQKMIKDSSLHTFDVVLVYKLDRFSRDKYQSAINRNILKQNKVVVMSAMENIPNTPEGMLLESVLEGLNQYYSMELSQKIRRTIKIKQESEEYCGGKLTYGYSVENKKLVINEDEALVVKQIFGLIINGLEPIDVRSKLCFNGSIQKIIRNERYKGKNCPAIVTEDEWILANDMLDQISGNHSNHKRIRYNYKLSGKIFCGICGEHITGGVAKNGQYRYYECKHKCGLKRIDCAWLENAVISAVMELITDEENLNRIAKECVRQLKEKMKAEFDTTAIKKKIDELNTKRDALIELYMNTKSSYINEKLLALDEEQEKLEKELYASNHVRATVPDIIRFIREFKECPPEILQDRIFNEIVRKVIVYENDIEIVIGDYIDSDDDTDKVRISNPKGHQRLEVRTSSLSVWIPRKKKTEVCTSAFSLWSENE